MSTQTIDNYITRTVFQHVFLKHLKYPKTYKGKIKFIVCYPFVLENNLVENRNQKQV